MSVDVSSPSRRRVVAGVVALLFAASCIISIEADLVRASTFLSVDGYLTQICRAMGLDTHAGNREPVDQCLSFLERRRILTVNTAQGVQPGAGSANTVLGAAQYSATANASQSSRAPITSVTAGTRQVRLTEPLTRDFALEVSNRIARPPVPSFLSQAYVDGTLLADHASALELARTHGDNQDPNDLFDADAHEHQHHCPTPHHHHAPHEQPCPDQP